MPVISDVDSMHSACPGHASSTICGPENEEEKKQTLRKGGPSLPGVRGRRGARESTKENNVTRRERTLRHNGLPSFLPPWPVQLLPQHMRAYRSDPLKSPWIQHSSHCGNCRAPQAQALPKAMVRSLPIRHTQPTRPH